jgi:hypothetical protein
MQVARLVVDARSNCTDDDGDGDGDGNGARVPITHAAAALAQLVASASRPCALDLIWLLDGATVAGIGSLSGDAAPACPAWWPAWCLALARATLSLAAVRLLVVAVAVAVAVDAVGSAVSSATTTTAALSSPPPASSTLSACKWLSILREWLLPSVMVIPCASMDAAMAAADALRTAVEACPAAACTSIVPFFLDSDGGDTDSRPCLPPSTAAILCRIDDLDTGVDASQDAADQMRVPNALRVGAVLPQPVPDEWAALVRGWSLSVHLVGAPAAATRHPGGWWALVDCGTGDVRLLVVDGGAQDNTGMLWPLVAPADMASEMLAGMVPHMDDVARLLGAVETERRCVQSEDARF